MKLQDEPFYQIIRKEKSIESRLYDQKRKLININDEIIFIRIKNPIEEVKVLVKAIYNYPTFIELLKIFHQNYLDGQQIQHHKKCQMI